MSPGVRPVPLAPAAPRPGYDSSSKSAAERPSAAATRAIAAGVPSISMNTPIGVSSIMTTAPPRAYSSRYFSDRKHRLKAEATRSASATAASPMAVSISSRLLTGPGWTGPLKVRNGDAVAPDAKGAPARRRCASAVSKGDRRAGGETREAAAGRSEPPGAPPRSCRTRV